MDIPTIDWSGETWRLREEWGDYHPSRTYQWTDPGATRVQDGHLVLKTHRNPRQFGDLTILTGTGLACAVRGTGRGSYKIVARLPRGPWLWPAFWLTSLDSWPPEVDVLEAYSGPRGGYLRPTIRRPLALFRAETNAYVGSPDSWHDLGARRGLLLRDPAKHYLEYRVDWLPDRLEIWWDERLVRTIRDKELLSQLDRAEGRVRPIINTNTQRQHDPDSPPTEFWVREYGHEPL